MFEAAVKVIQKYRKKQISSKDTFDILRPVNIIRNVLGFRILEYPRGHPRPRLSLLYMGILGCAYCGAWYCQGQMMQSSKDLDLQDVLFNITGAINQFAMFVIVAVGFYQTKSLKQFARRIHEIDVTLQALGSPPSFNIVYKKTMAMISFVTCYLIVYTLGCVFVYQSIQDFPNKTPQEISSIFTQLYGQSIEFILIIEFLAIVSCIKSEFRRANDLLSDFNVLPFSSIAIELLNHKESNDPHLVNKCFFPSSNKLFTLLPSSQRLRSTLQLTSHELIRNRRLLQTIRQVHLELYRISKHIGTVYGIQVSIEMGLCILYTTYYLCNLYHRYQEQAHNSFLLIGQTIGTCALCFNNAIKIYGVNYICERMSREAESTNEIIYTFYGQNTDYEIHEEMEMFSLQMMQCRPSYSAFGLYSLNCKNVCSCIGTITTYVIIMIQVTSTIMEEVS